MSGGNEGQASLEIAPQILPEIIHEGRYRLYRLPDGGMHLVYKRNDTDREDHLELPAAMVKMADLAAQGKMSPVEMIKGLMEMRK